MQRRRRGKYVHYSHTATQPTSEGETLCAALGSVFTVSQGSVSCVSCHRQLGSHRPDCCSVPTDQMLGPGLGSQVTQRQQKPRTRYNQYRSQRSPADRDPVRLCANYQLRPTASYFQPSPPPLQWPGRHFTIYCVKVRNAIKTWREVSTVSTLSAWAQSRDTGCTTEPLSTH